MFISQKGLDLIKEFEGCKLQSYDDYNNRTVNAGEPYRGTLTIGYGHIEGVYAGQKISQQEADDLLSNDMIKYCNQVQEVINEGIVTFPVSQNMFDALVSFDYNLGQGCVRTLCQNRDKATVADKMLLYINPGSVWEQGLLRRRNAERELFLSDVEAAPVIIPVESPKPQGDGWVSRLQQECNNQGFSNQVVDGFPGPNTLKGCPLIKYGAKGDITKLLQEKLVSMGYNTNGIDGIFGNGTLNAVIAFQRNNGLVDDGVVGEHTWAKILGL